MWSTGPLRWSASPHCINEIQSCLLVSWLSFCSTVIPLYYISCIWFGLEIQIGRLDDDVIHCLGVRLRRVDV